MLNYLTLLIALVVAGIAAYFSTVGIGLIFSGSFYAAVIMGCSLEAGKIVAVSWLYRHWKIAHLLLKIYLLVAITVLSLITSLGIFGFLSRANIAQQISMETGAASQLELIDSQIEQHKTSIKDIDARLALIDDAIRNMITNNRAKGSLAAADQQAKNRGALNYERSRNVTDLNTLLTTRANRANEVKTALVEVGPIRYFAAFFFGKEDRGTLEHAVRWLILIIIFVFDPLSISLFIAYNTGAVNKSLTGRTDSDTIHINKNNLTEM